MKKHYHLAAICDNCFRIFNSWSLYLTFALLFTSSLAFSALAQEKVETFTSSGTWTVPDGVTQITVEAWGAGGGGGGSNNNNNGGSGGGGGGHTSNTFSVIPSQSVPYTVGAGGAGGAANNGTGGNGGQTSILSLIANGGTGGAGNGGTPGTGGTASGGTNTTGGIGTQGNDYGQVGGAGANGGIGGAQVSKSNGNPGVIPGGGGGGGKKYWPTNNAGGAGANGQIRITYTPADYLALFNTMSIGSKIWELGETRTVTVTVTNYGRESWTDASPDINIGVKWNGDPDYLVRVNAGGLNPGESASYSFSVTAPTTEGINNLSFDVVNELNCWFGNNNGSCGPGNTVFRSEDLAIVPSIEKYYSYRTGSWNDPTTWTHDPSGTTQVCETVPQNYSEVYILSGREVSLSEDVAAENLNVSIASGGVLNIKDFEFSNELLYLRGEGTLRLASINFPSVSTNQFVQAGGGTTEYNNSTAFTFPAAQTQYNNLTLNAPGITASMMSDLVLNGDLTVKAGAFRISDNSSTSKYTLTINGDVLVNSGAALTVGTGKTNSTNTPTGITGGTAPFLNYYTQFHTVIVKGNFTNNGTVRFTNLDYPIFNAFPSAAGKTGAATVYFQGASNNTLSCNGTTDFYNLVLDKGLDQTYKLTVYSTAYNRFRLFGANSSGGDTNGATNENPNLKKALWIRTGTLELTGLTVIPSLSEGSVGGTPNSDFYVPANGSLVLNGPDVIVLSTADTYDEVNAAYSVSGGTGPVNGVNKGVEASSFSVYGNFQVKDGYFSTRESGGLIFWDYASGQVNIAGGYVDAKQIRAAGGSSGLASYQQTGGTLALRGRYQRVPAQYSTPADLRANTLATINTTQASGGLNGNMGTFNLNAPANVFAMSGGTIQVYDVSGSTNDYAIDIFASANNINVSGGTIELLPLSGSDNFIVRSNAPFGNMVINRTGGTSEVQLGAGYPLTVLKDLTITAGYFRTNNLDVTIGGNFTVNTNGTYHSGTNTTLFNGTNGQTFTINGTINNGANGLNKLSVNKQSGILKLDGTKTDLTVRGALTLTKGTLDDGGKIIYVAGNVTNSGIHTGTGRIELSGTTAQTIGGDGNGVFENLTLNNNNAAAAPVSLAANTTINGELSFAKDKHLNIGSYNLKLNANASFSSADANSYIQTSGNAGDGGLTLTYNSIAARTFPLGVENYTPATMGFSSAPSTYGTITVVPVNYEHTVTTTKNISLKYFWRVKSDGFSGYDGKVTHQFVYNQSDVSGTEGNYVPAMYNASSYTWSYGAATDVNTTDNIISDWTASANFLDGDYTAGVATAFGTPAKFYSRQTGLWNESSTWSTTSHTGVTASRIPVAGDVVIIGADHTVSLKRTENDDRWTWNVDERDKKNEGVQNCASLQIEQGGVLDIKYSPASNFGMVLSHPNGNGLLRVSTQYSDKGTFEFPQGDFTEFNANLGTTELYSINGTAGTTYWLPNNIDNYGNLILSPLGGSNIIFGNTDVTIYGDLTTRGQNSESWFCPTWNSDYPTAPYSITAKTITINGNMHLQGGALVFYGNGNITQDFVIKGNVIVDELAGIKTQDVTGNWGNIISSSTNQSISIGGDLVNNASPGSDPNQYAGCDFSDIPLTFFGETDASITNTAGTPSTMLGQVTVNKGSSQSTKLTINIGGSLSTPADNWLTLENGTLEYKRVNPNSDFTITTTSQFNIPPTAGLYVDYVQNSGNRNILIANSNSNTNDMYLNGKLTLVNGNVYVGATSSPAYNNDIEYSGGGASAIEVKGGKLVVNGQIRRNPATTSGVLSYTQSGGEVTIKGNNANTTNAKLEVLNAGSKFNMSGGTLTLLRGGGGNAYGDLYLRPASSVVTGGDIIFANQASGAAQTYQLDATVALNNVSVTGYSSGDATVKLLISPLTLKGNLLLSNANSIFDANSEFNIGLTIKGDFENNGTYNHYNNLTVFNGGEQELLGTSV
ncbi:MAG TPA: hypothetical protein DDW62_01175, partial [Marinilabiliaceae bacterium]|nr:hypothetical protein [Marinilabiliaceae bacterium]